MIASMFFVLWNMAVSEDKYSILLWKAAVPFIAWRDWTQQKKSYIRSKWQGCWTYPFPTPTCAWLSAPAKFPTENSDIQITILLPGNGCFLTIKLGGSGCCCCFCLMNSGKCNGKTAPHSPLTSLICQSTMGLLNLSSSDVSAKCSNWILLSPLSACPDDIR